MATLAKQHSEASPILTISQQQIGSKGLQWIVLRLDSSWGRDSFLFRKTPLRICILCNPSSFRCFVPVLSFGLCCCEVILLLLWGDYRSTLLSSLSICLDLLSWLLGCSIKTTSHVTPWWIAWIDFLESIVWPHDLSFHCLKSPRVQINALKWIAQTISIS